MKICSKCKAEKPTEEFNRCSRNKSGLSYRCKVCDAAYHMANKARISERRAEHYRKNKDRIKLKVSAYQSSNKKNISKQKAEYYNANKESCAIRSAKYKTYNPEKRAAHHRNRRARIRDAEGRHTGADVRTIFAKQQGLCANCQTKLFKSGVKKYHVDHIIPLALGGSNWPSNLQCLCPSCNLRKKDKDPLEWAEQNGRLL